MQKPDLTRPFISFCFSGLLILSLINTSSLFARTALSFQHLNDRDGLTSVALFDITQDSHGFIWFAGDNGLHRFDGHRFIDFNHDPDDQTSLTSNTVYNLLVANNELWLTTADGYLHHLLPDGSFEHFAIQNSVDGESQRADPYNILFDNKESIWISTSQGVFSFSIQQKKFTSHVAPKDNEILFSLSFDDATRVLYIGASGGNIYQLLVDSTEQKSAVLKTPNGLTAINIFIDKSRWIVTAEKIFQWKSDNQLVEVEIPKDAEFNGIRESAMHNGIIWLFSDIHGLFRYSISEKTLQNYVPDPHDLQSIKSRSVSVGYVDQGEQLWLGSPGVGAFRTSLRSTGFNKIAAQNMGQTGLSNNDYCDISEAKSGELYFSTCTAGFRKLSRDRKHFTDLTYKLSSAMNSNNGKHNDLVNVMSHWVENENSIWLGTFEELIHWNGEDEAKVFSVSRSPNQLPSSALTIHKDPQQRLWIGTYIGISQFLPDKNHFINFNNPTENRKALSAKTVLVIKDAGKDELWLGTRGQGLWRFNVINGNTTQYAFDYNIANSISNNDIYDIVETRNGTLWVGTGAGLNKAIFNKETSQYEFKRYTHKHGLVDDRIRSIVEAPDGKLWLGTNSGIISFNPDTEASLFFNYSHNLPAGGYNSSAGLLSQDGYIYIGGYNGLAQITPKQPQTAFQQFPLVVTGYSIGNRKVKVLDPTNVPLLELDYENNRLKLEFSILDFSAPEFHRYQYRLKGFENEWQEIGPQAEAIYNHLPSGNYTLDITNKNNGDNSKLGHIMLAVKVNPAPWRSSLAYLLYVSVTLSILAIVTYFSWKKRLRERAYVNAIKTSEERMKLALKGSGNVIWDWKVKSNEVYRAGLSILGYEEMEITTPIESFDQIIHPEDKEYWRQLAKKILNGKQNKFSAELRLRHKEGRWVWIRNEGEVVRSYRDTGKPLRIAGTLQNITAQKFAEQELRQLANYDTLTGLPNRNYFDKILPELITQNNDNNALLALLFVDIDRFKNINDSLGHQFGDKVLIAAAKRLQETLPDSTVIARFGGDEFTIILTESKHESDIKVIAKSLLDSFSRTLSVDNTEVIVSLSIGISLCPNDSQVSHTLIQYADTAMYYSKSAGRNTYSMFNIEYLARTSKRLELENSLHHALEAGEFYPVYQPKMDVESGLCKSAEALLRWHSKEHGLIPPSDFIPILEDTGLISPVTDWLLEEVCNQYTKWTSNHDVEINLAVNLSVRQLMRQPITDAVTTILAKTQTPASSIELEITESALMENASQLASMLGELKSLGVNLSIDDFGTGYSSFSYLSQLPVDKLKIDKSFIDKIESGERAKTLCLAIISMAHELGLKVVAEGVENQNQLSFLVEARCDEIQGYYYSKPLTSEQFETFLLNSSSVKKIL
ncbi:EAL domain-containing protein [Aliikangiella coralliicola]|uniref:cyclic-guanylate-specific phosphodiesterase n=1 Tax=Aliikangiella coralliicola TaxID=2592383 RepID=A0A545UE40_9GAMM|nr:EAL domain-containing protein [Aliikangiella coralliicola]TQV87734.1 EAL domain-containing protein [Aliikangiella coralliicola]